jgi:hypothetical protein
MDSLDAADLVEDAVRAERRRCREAVLEALRLEALRVGMTHERSLTCGCVLCRVWQAVPEWLREE